MTNQRYIKGEQNDDALAREASRNTSQTSIQFRIMGDMLVFTYPIESGQELKYTYKSKNFAKFLPENETNYVYKNSFSNDKDLFLMDEELLILKAIAIRSMLIEFSDAGKREEDYQRRLSVKMSEDGNKTSYNMFQGEAFNKTTSTEWNPVGRSGW